MKIYVKVRPNDIEGAKKYANLYLGNPHGYARIPYGKLIRDDGWERWVIELEVEKVGGDYVGPCKTIIEGMPETEWYKFIKSGARVVSNSK